MTLRGPSSTPKLPAREATSALFERSHTRRGSTGSPTSGQVTRTCELVDRLALVLGPPGTGSGDFIEAHGFVPACGGDA
jgi:hypothetical protein